jgi:hypothetical protein
VVNTMIFTINVIFSSSSSSSSSSFSITVSSYSFSNIMTTTTPFYAFCFFTYKWPPLPVKRGIRHIYYYCSQQCS